MTDKPFFEEDEPVEKIRAKWERGQKGRTERPASSFGIDVEWIPSTTRIEDVKVFEPEAAVRVVGRVKP